MWINRKAENEVRELLALFPAVAILGPRQCGKSSLARRLLDQVNGGIILDLERPSDQRRLEDAEMFFEANREAMICIDEIQRSPDLFPLLRAEIDAKREPGRFLILGSASRDLIRQSSESLAGRIAFYELTPFLAEETIHSEEQQRRLWYRGGFPDCYLSKTDRAAMLWRKNFIQSFVERDIPQLGFNIDRNRLMRMLVLCAHQQGQLLNAAKMAQFLEVSGQTARNHLELLNGTFILRTLTPYSGNRKKRLVKTPKVYIRDSGILHQLLEIGSYNELLGHPVLGASWEGFAIEQILSANPDWSYSFYRTGHGAEIDLIIERKGKKTAVELKCSKSPKIPRGFYNGLEDLGISDAWVVIPSEGCYPSGSVNISGLRGFLGYLAKE